jgi:hypothetical protein
VAAAELRKGLMSGGGDLLAGKKRSALEELVSVAGSLLTSWRGDAGGEVVEASALGSGAVCATSSSYTAAVSLYRNEAGTDRLLR